MIDKAAANQVALLINERSSSPYSVKSFSDNWRDVRDAAARSIPSVAGLQFRDLRRTFGVWSRSGGATKEDVGDVLGNSAATDPKLGQTYMPAQLDTVSRAVSAIQRPIGFGKVVK